MKHRISSAGADAVRSGRHQAQLLIECCCNRRRQAWAAFPASGPDFSGAVFLKRQTSSTGAAGIQFFFFAYQGSRFGDGVSMVYCLVWGFRHYSWRGIILEALDIRH